MLKSNILIYMCNACTLYSTELQNDIQLLQEIITYLTLQLRKKEETTVHLTDNIKGIFTTCILFNFIHCRSEVSDIRGERLP